MDNPVNTVTVQFNMHLPVEIVKKRNIYVSFCPILDVASQGETEDEARLNLIEAITAFAISCLRRGTLEKVLSDCGFSPAENYHGNIDHKRDFDYIDVPIPLIASYQKQQRECHA